MATLSADLQVFPLTNSPLTLSKSLTSQSRWTYYAMVMAVILSIYSYPALRAGIATKTLRLPPVTAPDEGLYLSISDIQRDSAGRLVNPYYHLVVPSPVSYLKFRLGPSLFG